MTDEVKKLIESVTVFTQYDVACSGGLTEWVSKSDFDRVVKHLCDNLEVKTKQKLTYERMYDEADELLIKHGIRKAPITIDLSHNA